MTKTVTAAIITLNEERNLPRALASVRWADEIVVADAGSQDRTIELARTAGARTFTRAWTGYVDQKNYAAAQASHPWVFSLDADEACSDNLQSELAAWREAPEDGRAGYFVPRLSWFLGRWIRHTDWRPDYQLRLFRRDQAHWQGGQVHESIRLSGPAGHFHGDLLHYPYASLGEYIRKLDRYSLLAAQDQAARGRCCSPVRLLLSPPASFCRSYLLKRGFLDGTPGLIVSGLSALSKFLRLARLYELSRSAGHSAPPPA